jgi:hypothetical protein
MKNKIHLLEIPKRSQFHEFALSVIKLVDDETHAVGIFIMKKDRTVLSGLSYAAGLTKADVKGGCAQMQEDIIEMVWGVNNGNKTP